MDYVKKALTFLSIILITIGAVGLCGCMSSNEGNINGKTVENGGMKEAVNTEQNYQSQLSPFSNTVKVKVPYGFEFEIPKDDYEAMQKGDIRCPKWYVERAERDAKKFNLSKETLNELEKNNFYWIGYMVPISLGDREGFSGVGYNYNEKKWEWVNIYSLRVYIVSNKTFDEFLLINGINPYTLDKDKYNQYLKEYIKVRKDLEDWFNKYIKGHPLCTGKLGIYSSNFDEELAIYILKNGWGYLPTGIIEYNGTTPINPWNKKEFPLAYKYTQLTINAQLYAKKHKLGIWAINFNESDES